MGTQAAASGSGDVSYDNTDGTFTYTPPNLSPYQTTANLNSDIDSHLNQSNPTDGHVLSWTSGDYLWVAQSGGGASLANFSFSTDTGASPVIGIIQTSDPGGVMIDDPTEITGPLKLSGAGQALLVNNNVQINGTININSTLNTHTIPSGTGTLALTSDLSGFLSSVAGDSTPQLGGDLDLNTNNITGKGQIKLESNTFGTNAAARLGFFKSNTDQVAGDEIGEIYFNAYQADDTTEFTFASIRAFQSQVSSNATGQRGEITFNVPNSDGSLQAQVGVDELGLHLKTDAVIRFEGSADNNFETTITVSNPSADRTITFPDATGTVALTSDLSAGYSDGDVDTHLNQSSAGTNQVLSWNGSDYAWVAQTTAYANSDVDAHLNQSNPTSGYVLSWNGTDYAWVAQTTAYANSDVDAHLNQSNPTSGYVLSWNGTDYAWVAQSGGGGLADVVDDTTPQLGGNLDTNGKQINFGDSDGSATNMATFGASNDLKIYHFGNTYIENINWDLTIRNSANDYDVKIQTDNGSGGIANYFVADGSTGAAEMHWGDYSTNSGADGGVKLKTTAGGVDITGNLDVSDNIYVQGSASDGGAIFLNSAQTGTPSSSSTNWSYLTVERGGLPNVSIRWNEGSDVWEFTNDGSNYYAIPTSGGSIPTLDQVLTSGDESDNTLTLYRTTDGNSAQGSLIFESRDTSPIPNNSMGDIRFYMDNDSNISTSTLGEYARISAKGQQVASGSAANNTGFIEFQTKTKSGVDTLMQVGFDPWSASGSSSGGNIGTVMHERAYVNGNFYLYQQVDTANDITSDAGLYMHLTAYDSVSGTIQNRGEINHQNGVFRIIHRNRNNTAEYGQLTIPHSSSTPLRIYYADDNSTHDIISEKNFDATFNNRMLDDDNLVRFNQYANTEYITTTTDFGGFNGGSSGQASLVPGNGGFGALAFFTWADADNGTASTHRYIPAGHTEEAVHGMGILRDSGQHSFGTPRWDPFGGPDFRISLDSSASDANYFFGSTSTSATKHTTNLIITNSDSTPLDGDDIARIKFRTGEDSYTQYRDYAEIVVNAQDTAAGAYDARMTLWVNNNGGTGANANIGIKLDGQGTTIQSRASQHYFGEFPNATLDTDVYPTDNYIKLITDSDDTRQVIQSAGDMWFSVDTAVSANTVMQLSSSEITMNSPVIFPNFTTTERNAISNPVAGMVVFNTTDTKLQVYTGSGWVDLH